MRRIATKWLKESRLRARYPEDRAMRTEAGLDWAEAFGLGGNQKNHAKKVPTGSWECMNDFAAARLESDGGGDRFTFTLPAD